LALYPWQVDGILTIKMTQASVGAIRLALVIINIKNPHFRYLQKKKKKKKHGKFRTIKIQKKKKREGRW